MIAGPSTNPIPERAETGFPVAPVTASRPRTNCVPVHRFRMGRTPETGLYPGWNGEFPRYAICAQPLMHAVKTEPARFWRVFGGLLPVLPVSSRNALEGLSGGADNARYGNVKTFP